MDSGEGNMQGAAPKKTPPASYDLELESLINRLQENKPMGSVTRSLITIKMEQILKLGNDGVEEKAALWKFCDSHYQKLVQLCDKRQFDQAKIVADKIRLVVLGLRSENFASRILKDCYMEMEDMYILNADMIMLLIQYRIVSVPEWDSAISDYIENCSG